MAYERAWESVGPVAFTATGGQDGTVTLSSTAGFKVKQSIVISAISLPTLKLEVKRVISLTKLIVGPIVTTGKMLARENLSLYTVALLSNIRAEEQKKSLLPPNDIIQAVYEQEPAVAIRTIGVDKFGRSIDTVDNGDGKVRLAVDASVTLAPASKAYDDIILTRDSDGDITLVRKYLLGNLIRTQALSYDVNKDLIEVKDV
jgi:hypothetical protein